jgi:hypothetical protein
VKRLAIVVCAVAATASAAPKKKGGKAPTAPAADAPAPDPTPAPPPPPAPAEDTPWSKGVPADVQAKANALYDEGNQLFAQQAHQPALEKYKAAVALWDHPLIRFNLAVTEIRLDKVLEAADDLDDALKYGDKPFKPELYQQALDYQTLIKGRVGYVEASCDTTASHLLLDGKPWFDCPGTKKVRITAGEHAVVGEKKDYLTTSQKLVVTGGATATAKVVLIPLDAAVKLEYPQRRWVPWTMAGTGLAVGLAGVGTYFLGKNQMDQFQSDYAVQCATGCEPGLTDPQHRSLKDEQDGAELKGKIGIGMMAAGGGVLVVGVVMAIMNRPHRVLPQVEVAPQAGGAAASMGWHF